MVQISPHGLRRQVARKLQLRDPTNVAAIGLREPLASPHHLVGDLRVHVLERIARLQRRIRPVRTCIRWTFVASRVDPYTAGGVLDRNLESKLRSRGLQYLGRDLDIDECRADGDDPHGTPLSGGLQRAAQQRGGVVGLGVTDLGLDALLGQRFLVVLQLRRHAWIKRVHADVEPLLVRNLTIGLDRVDLRKGLGLVDDAPAEQGKQHQATRGPHRTPERAGDHFPALFL